jgi:hypothetical protein
MGRISRIVVAPYPILILLIGLSAFSSYLPDNVIESFLRSRGVRRIGILLSKTLVIEGG